MSQSGDRKRDAGVAEVIETLQEVLVKLADLDLSPDIGAHVDHALTRLEQIADSGSNPT